MTVMRALIATTLLLAACGEAAPTTDGGADTTPTADTSGDTGPDGALPLCTSLSNDDCADRADCDLVDQCPDCDQPGTDPGQRCLPAGSSVPPCQRCEVPQCRDLDEAGCNAADDSMGCTAVSCPSCSGQTYVGCFGPTEAAPACEPTDCLPGCRSDTDCTGNAESCVGPDDPAGCGACRPDPPTCSADADCDTGSICVPIPCSCDGTGTQCVPGCTADSDCAAHESCGTDNRCAPRDCSVDADCPAHFDCGGVAGACARRECAADGDCETGGMCVNGACHEQLGVCLPPAA